MKEYKFITPCVVTVNNERTLFDSLNYLKDIGYFVTDECYYFHKDPATVLCRWDKVTVYASGRHKYDEEEFYSEEIDCGSDIELFEVLSAMNNENNKNQWFVSSGVFPVRWMFSKEETVPNDDVWGIARKATTGEIIEFYNEKRKGKKFLNNCSITITDTDIRKNVIKYLQDLGYNILFSVRHDYGGDVISTNEYGTVNTRRGINDIECDDVEMFKALVVMNDKNDHYKNK